MALSDEEQQKLDELVDLDKSAMDDGELTSRVQLSLRRKYEYPEWALFFEVPGKNGRRADAIAYNLFPSRNFRTVGFEIKVSRNDWKKELEDGEKADYFVGQCDEWYVVAGRKGIVKESELPEGWGLLEMKGGGKLYRIVGSQLTAHQNRPLDREFYMRAVKKALKRAKKAKRQKRVARREGYREGKKEGQKMGGEMDREMKRLLRNGEKMEELQEKGVNLWGLDDEERISRFKRAIRLLQQVESNEFMVETGQPMGRRVRNMRKQVKDLLSGIDAIEEELDGLRSELTK